MIKVAKQDQDVLQFLWFNDVHAKCPEVQIFKFTRVVLGVSPSPYLLNATIVEHLKKFEKVYTSTMHKIKNSIYVDDVLVVYLKHLSYIRSLKRYFVRVGLI